MPMGVEVAKCGIAPPNEKSLPFSLGSSCSHSFEIQALVFLDTREPCDHVDFINVFDFAIQRSNYQLCLCHMCNAFSLDSKPLALIKTTIQNPALPAAQAAQGFVFFIFNCDHLLITVSPLPCFQSFLMKQWLKRLCFTPTAGYIKD